MNPNMNMNNHSNNNNPSPSISNCFITENGTLQALPTTPETQEYLSPQQPHNTTHSIHNNNDYIQPFTTIPHSTSLPTLPTPTSPTPSSKPIPEFKPKPIPNATNGDNTNNKQQQQGDDVGGLKNKKLGGAIGVGFNGINTSLLQKKLWEQKSNEETTKSMLAARRETFANLNQKKENGGNAVMERRQTIGAMEEIRDKEKGKEKEEEEEEEEEEGEEENEEGDNYLDLSRAVKEEKEEEKEGGEEEEDNYYWNDGKGGRAGEFKIESPSVIRNVNYG
eukprot:TRINITY_DN2249_c0_g1_i1.p1 TRINITY_DN2249_c0_g1~~TRINITY_DN2249_c0_g1_i1.p1  ORF type:complete len:278 (-),score=167.09 TRINITY_DN2249_c0_g1_i1:86-919(-)